MHVEMAPARLAGMCVLLLFEFDRNRNQASMAHSALGDDMPREIAHIAHRPS